MRPPSRTRPLALPLAVAAAGLTAGLLAGCDDPATAAERQVTTGMADAAQAAAAAPGAPAGSPEAQAAADKTRKQLAAVAKVQDAPPATKVQVSAMLAAADDWVAANQLTRLGELRLTADRLIADLHRRALDVQFAAALVSGFEQLDPKAPLGQIDQALAGVRQGDAWKPAAGASFPTLESVNAEIDRLQQQIGQAESRGADLDKKRNDLLNQSEKLAQQSQASKGDASVAVFTQSSDLRKQANDLATDKSVVDAGLMPLRADLALAQARKTALEGAISTLQAQKQAVQSGWADVQKQIDQLQTSNRATLTGGGGTTSAPAAPADASDISSAAPRSQMSIAQMANEAQSTLDELDGLLAKTDQSLTDSAKGYSSASDTAKTYGVALKAQAEAANPQTAASSPYTVLADTLAPSYYTLGAANERDVLATLHLQEVSRLLRQKAMLAAVQAAAKAAGAAVPDALGRSPVGGDLDAQISAASDKADKAFKQALADYQNLAAGRVDPSVKLAAAAGSMFANYGYALLNRLQADAGLGDGAAAAADTHLSDAKAAYEQLKQQAQSSKTPLPELPTELTGEAPTTAPSTTAPAAAETPAP